MLNRATSYRCPFFVTKHLDNIAAMRKRNCSGKPVIESFLTAPVQVSDLISYFREIHVIVQQFEDFANFPFSKPVFPSFRIFKIPKKGISQILGSLQYLFSNSNEGHHSKCFCRNVNLVESDSHKSFDIKVIEKEGKFGKQFRKTENTKIN